MSAVVCRKRSFFEELPSSVVGVPVNKKIRWSSYSSPTSPVRFSSLSNPFAAGEPRGLLIDRLCEIFPHMDRQLLDKVLEESGDDIDAAIRRLQELQLGSSEVNAASVAEPENNTVENGVDANGGVAPEDPANHNALPTNGAEWVEWFVREMTNATTLDDARARASRLLDILEKSIKSRAHAEAAETYHKENVMLKEQNTILKQAVVIQHERQKEHEDVARELQHLKQLVPQYQEQLRNLEVANYTLRMHLKQTEEHSSIPGRFHPDVF